MRRHLRKIALIILAVIFLGLGVLGLALPFLQGILFIVIGIVLLSIASTRFRAWAETHTRKFPHIHRIVERVRERAERLIGE